MNKNNIYVNLQNMLKQMVYEYNWTSMRLIILYISGILLMFSIRINSLQAQTNIQNKQTITQVGIPQVIALFYKPGNSRGLVRMDDLLYFIVDKMHIDRDWRVEEIRREKVLFYRSSSKSFIEIPIYDIEADYKRFHRDYSFFGKPISLWEALLIISGGFEYNVVMHFMAGGTVVPNHHGLRIEQFIRKFIPAHHRYFINNNNVFVLPVRSYFESWSDIKRRLLQFNPLSLEKRFTGLKKYGTLISQGDDIQFVLRKISLGGNTPIRFPKHLHFPVYAYLKNVSFSFILTYIVYLNQCVIIERENCIEIQPIILSFEARASEDKVIVEPYEPQNGFGPAPPFPILPSNVKFIGVTKK